MPSGTNDPEAGRLVEFTGEPHRCRGEIDDACEIEVLHPVEVRLPAPSRNRKYPFEHMEPGQGIFLRCDPDEREKVSARLSSAAGYWFSKYQPDHRLVTCKVRDGVRGWVVRRTEGA